MNRRLLLILLSSCLFAGVITTLLIALLLAQRPVDINRMRCDMSGIFYGIGWGFIILMTIGTLPVYLNRYPTIRNNIYYSLLSFFLLPLLTAFSLIVSLGDFTEQLKEYAVMTLPYLAVLSLHFYRFRQYIQNQYNQKNEAI